MEQVLERYHEPLLIRHGALAELTGQYCPGGASVATHKLPKDKCETHKEAEDKRTHDKFPQ